MAAAMKLKKAGIEDKPLLRRLMELYRYDFSEYDGSDVSALGEYGYKYLDHYWTDRGRIPYLIVADGHWAGFALVRQVKSEPTTWSMSEFFIMKKYRPGQIFCNTPGKSGT